MKKTLLTIGVVLAAAFMFFTVWTGGASRQVQQNWEIELPKDGTEVYNFSKESGASYYAFIYDSAEEAKGEIAWQETEGTTNEDGSYLEAIEVWMEEAEVPNTLPIDIVEGPYYYECKEDGSELIAVLDNKMIHLISKTAE